MEFAPLSTFAPNLFAGRTALVTGGGRGIGREIALAFANLGADVVIASRNDANLAPTARDIEALGRNCLAQVANVRKPEEIDALVAEAEKGKPILDFKAVDGVVHTVWRMPDAAKAVKAFDSVPAAYIADGHHRAAASTRVGIERTP